jgi:sigma-E factor negative regulatory protein RseC
MDNPQGRIQSLVHDEHGEHAVVGVDALVVCARCAAGKGCGAGLFGSSSRLRQIEVSVPQGLQVSEGDLVEIAMAPNNLLRASLIVYGLPLVGAVLAAALAFGLQLGDVAASAAALAGLGAGLVYGRWMLQREACLSRFIPRIERKLTEPQAT